MNTSHEPGSGVLALEPPLSCLRRARCSPRISDLRGLLLLLLAVLFGYPYQVVAQQAVALPQTPAAVQNGKAQLLGQYDPAQKLRLVFGLQPPHSQEEEQFLRDLQDPDSPLFHKYLSAEEWNERFAPSVQDEQAVVDWATTNGLAVTQRYPNRLLIDVEAPVALIESAFAVKINRYQFNSKEVFSNDRDPSIPASLAGIVHSLNGLNNLQVVHAASGNRKEMAAARLLAGSCVPGRNPYPRRG